MRLELAAGMRTDVAQTRHVGIVENRLRHFKAHRRIDVVGVEQVRFRSDEGYQRHHHRFADRVYRRIGHLREQLLEIVIQRLVLVGHDRQRRVVTHRSGRFFGLHRHGRHQELQVFLGIAEQLLAIKQWDSRLGFFRLRFYFAELDANRVNPLFVRFCVCVRILEFLVIDDATGIQIDQEHLARLQTPFLNDFRFWNRQHAGFRCHDHQIVIRDNVPCGTQTIAVQRSADMATVGECHCCRSVPRLHHCGMVLIKSATIVIHQRMVFPCFRNHHHHGLRNRITSHDQ